MYSYHEDAHDPASREYIGVFPPDRFKFLDITIDGLSALAWKLLGSVCCNGKLKEGVPIAEVMASLWGINPKIKADVDSKAKALGELRRRTQKKLDDEKIPLVFDQKNNHFRLMHVK